MMARRPALTFLLPSILLLWGAPALQAATPCTPQDTAVAAPVEAGVHARVEAALRKQFESQELVGLAAAIVEGDTITEFYFGFEDREKGVDVTAKTMFRWASISKPLVAVRALQLVRADALDLDADVITIVPEFPEKKWPVTSRQLLGHLGGVVHYTNGIVLRTKHDYDVEHPYADAVVALDRFNRSPLVAEPGTKYSYSTHGYMLLGAVVQKAGGDALWMQVEKHVAKPLGMATLQPDYQWVQIDHRAVGYRRTKGEVRTSTDTDVSWKLAGGGFISNVNDLARFGRGLCGETLLPRATLDVMWTSQATREGKKTGYGMGFGVSRPEGTLTIGHSGAQEKTRTYLRVRPDEGRAVAVMTNSEYGKTGAIATAMFAAMFAAMD